MTEGEIIQMTLGVGMFCGVLFIFSLVLMILGGLTRMIRMAWFTVTLPFRIVRRLL